MAGDSTPYDELRAGNPDREVVVARLNKAFGEGRLELAELDERVTAAYAAKTMGELRGLTADLPAEPAGRGGTPARAPVPPRPPRPDTVADLRQAALELAQQRINAKMARGQERALRHQQRAELHHQRAERHQRRHELTHRVTDYHPVLAWATTSTICFTIWLVSVITGGWQEPWFLWVAGPWGVLLLMRRLGQRSS